MSVKSVCTTLGDAVRNLTGGTSLLSLEGMTTALNKIVKRSASDLTKSGRTVTVPAGYYKTQATATVTDSNLIAENIKKGVSIFDVTGTLEESSGGYVCKTFSLKDQTTIDTGLSSIVRFELKKVSYSEAGLMVATYPYGDIGTTTILLVGCSTYNSYMKSVEMRNMMLSDYCDINGGTITWKGTSAYEMSTDKNYELVVWGTE